MTEPKTVLILSSYADSLLNFRGELLASLRASGFRVVAMSEPSEDIETRLKRDLNIEFEAFPITRNSMNPFVDLRTLLALRRALRKYKPDAVLTYTIKPVIYGGIAAIGLKKLHVVALIEGLGFTFAGQSLFQRLLRSAVCQMYRLALRQCKSVIFVNADDQREFVNRQIVPEIRCARVAGPGINLERFTAKAIPSGDPRVLMIARLVRSKGV